MALELSINEERYASTREYYLMEEERMCIEMKSSGYIAQTRESFIEISLAWLQGTTLFRLLCHLYFFTKVDEIFLSSSWNQGREHIYSSWSNIHMQMSCN